MKSNHSLKGVRNGSSGLGRRGNSRSRGCRGRSDWDPFHTGCPTLSQDSPHVAKAGITTSDILVAGIGNIFLGDDGFGPEAIRHVPQLAGPRVRLVDYGIRGIHLAYDLLDGCRALVLVDALPNRGAPGTIHVFEADTETLSSTMGLDAHGMDLSALFANLNALGGTAPPTIVIGCEVDTVEEGIGLSAAVAAAIPEAVRSIESVVAQLLTTSRVG
jgi:hydrogenase maturation protease